MPDDLSAQMQARGDLGQRIQHRNGHLEVDANATDPERPGHAAIKRSRRICHYDALWRAGGITSGEREAADRCAALYELEEGARERQDGPSHHRAPWAVAPALTALQAVAALRVVHQVVGRDGTALLRLYVAKNLPVPEIAKRRGENRDQTMGRIKAALGRAAEHWGME